MKECTFLQGLDNLQSAYKKETEAKSTWPIDERTEVHARMIACLLGLFIEHELDKCKGHSKEEN